MSDKKKDRPWDGRSRIPTQQYKENYNEIFKTKDDGQNLQVVGQFRGNRGRVLDRVHKCQEVASGPRGETETPH